MPVVAPYIPRTITVHLGPPDSNAANVTVPFSDYVKNVASSEIYPTWDESALRANILAIISFALNRVYTEFYRSRGYDFDITNSTAYDQAFVNGRGFFDNISRLVDELLTSYLRRPGFVEPLAAKFCNGTTVTCDGLSQWGSQNLARQGYSAPEILNSYYGSDVTVIQVALNRIAQNYPAIPRLDSVDGIFGPRTEAAVQRFQEIFGLSPDGIVGPATWNAIVRLYTAVTQLNELRSKGQQFYAINYAAPGSLQVGSSGEKVRLLQYWLSVLSSFIPTIPAPTVDGIYGSGTRAAVLAAQRFFGLPETGSVDNTTWEAIYNQYSGIENTALRSGENFPIQGQTAVPALARQGRTPEKTALTQFPGKDLALGSRDPVVREVVR